MNQRVVSLMDVLAPPGNDWLKEISRRRSDLPAGVHVHVVLLAPCLERHGEQRIRAEDGDARHRARGGGFPYLAGHEALGAPACELGDARAACRMAAARPCV